MDIVAFLIIGVIVHALFFSPGSGKSKPVPPEIESVLLSLIITAVLLWVGFRWAMGW